MKKILKRFFVTVQSGRVIDSNTEHLTDKGRGRITHTTRRPATRCPNCRRPITDINKLRGRCDYCRTQTCCDNCETKCKVCSRRLCGRCRRGFVGQSSIVTVCPICLNHLRQRQAFNDRLLIQNIRSKRQIMHQREIARLRALQLQAAGMRSRNQIQIAAIKTRNQMQLAKARINGRMAMIREINKLKIALLKERRNIGQRSYRSL
jgi:hypothetical protein